MQKHVNTESSMDELWSSEDDLQLARCLRGIEEGDLIEMLASIEGLDRRATRRIEAKLAEWGERVYALLIDNDLMEQVDALQQVLVRELGFRGDRQSYQHPYNSLLSRVLTRRRSLPILLSCVWSVVGREAGFRVEGVGMPAHFIVRVGGPEGVLLDPFDSGREIDREDCIEILERIAGQKIVWREDYLTPSTPQQIAIRVLRNLLGAYSRLDDGKNLYRSLRFLCAICPDDERLQLGLAQLTEAFGAMRLALDQYRMVAQRFAGTEEAQEAAEKARHLETHPLWLN